MNPYFTPEEITTIRQETPGTKHVIHFNHAGASLMATPTFQLIQEYQESELYYGGYETADKYRAQLSTVYELIAQFIGADPEEIAIVENATVAWQMAFHSLNLPKGAVVITSQASYASNYISYLQLKEQRGIEIRMIPNDEWGQVDIAKLEAAIDDHVKLISMVHIPTNSGLVNPVKKVGAIANAYQIPFLLDACQSVGQVPVNVQDIGCDMLSVTGRKYMRGPRGTGFLYVNKEMITKLSPPFLDLHSAHWHTPESYVIRKDAKRFENWETNLAAKLGLGAAVSYARQWGMDRISGQISLMAHLLRNKLSEVEGITVWDTGKIKGGITTFSMRNRTAQEIKQHLAKRHINVSVTAPSSTLLDATRRNLPDLVRASVHYFTTEEEIDQLVHSIRQLL